MAARSPSKAAARGVFAVVGEDSFLAERFVEELLRATVGGDGDNVEVLRGDETTWTRVLDLARTRSLFAPRRALLVRAADALKGPDEGLGAYLDDPNPEVALILVLPKADKRRTVFRVLLERAEVRKADPLKGASLRKFVSDEVRARHIPLGDDGLAELLERVGQDLRRVMGEVDKLAAYAQGRVGKLGADEVAALLGRGLARPLYKLADAFWARSAVPALELIEELLEDGEPAPRVLATLHRALRQVRGARALAAARVPHVEFAGRLGVQPFKTRDLAEAARRWTDTDLERAVAALARADRRLKTGTGAAPALTAAVVEACGGGGAVTPRPAR